MIDITVVCSESLNIVKISIGSHGIMCKDKDIEDLIPGYSLISY